MQFHWDRLGKTDTDYWRFLELLSDRIPVKNPDWTDHSGGGVYTTPSPLAFIGALEPFEFVTPLTLPGGQSGSVAMHLDMKFETTDKPCPPECGPVDARRWKVRQYVRPDPSTFP